MNAGLRCLEIYRIEIPMRSFEHAAARRQLSQGVIVRVDFDDGQVGWGEALPREYVTGETIDGVILDLCDRIWPAMRESGNPAPGSVERAIFTDGRCHNAALCAMDLAFAWRWFDRRGVLLPEFADGLHGMGVPGVAANPHGPVAFGSRVSGVLGSASPAKTARRLRLMRLYGLRDFKLKLGFGDSVDDENLGAVGRQIGRDIARGKCTLRVDVNGAWDKETTPQRVARLKALGVCVVEQPVYCGASELVQLARQCDLPLMADETLLELADARTLLAESKRIWWNIRLSKNGGLRAAIKLAKLAAESGVPFVIGAMVGETSILSAAQRRLLELVPTPRFIEGNYGRLLLSDDLCAESLRFGYGGKLKRLPGPGLGITIDPKRLAKYGKLARRLEA
jgi:muconate cycloisomerase